MAIAPGSPNLEAHSPTAADCFSMRKLLCLIFIAALAAALTTYGLWTTKRPAGHYLSDLRSMVAVNQGTPGERGNLLGIEPLLFATDYQNPQRLQRKLGAYLQQAREQHLLNEKTIVVLPEHIGTWLLLGGEKDELYQAANQAQALNWLAASNPVAFARAFVGAQGPGRLQDSYLRMKAAGVAADYQQLFGGLAREFGVTLVAGSVVLPEPSVRNGVLVVGSGALYNSALVFGRDGLPIGQPQRQARPGAEAQPLQVFPTPAGPLGLLLGNASTELQNYRQLDAQGVKLVAAPVAFTGLAPWQGAGLAPAQLAPLLGQQGTASVSVFSHGQFWEQRLGGISVIRQGAQAFTAPSAPVARLLNLWL